MTGLEPVTFCTQNKGQAALHPFQLVYGCHCREYLPCFPHGYFLYRNKMSLAISSFWSFLFIYSSSSRRSYQPTLTYMRYEKKKRVI
jgi:hypothetical protein